MKITALNGVHREYGARMVEFAGFEMPVEYSGIKDEHLTVRNGVGVFDVSHMGEFWVKGPSALELLSKVSSNDPALIHAGEAQYTCLPNGRGGIVDDLLIYCFGPEKYLLVVNASNIDKDWAWINSQNSCDALLENGSDSISQLAVQGPEAINTLQRLTEVDLRSIRNYHFVVGELAGIKDVIISATGYTGAGGFELYCSNAAVTPLWHSIFEAGAPLGIKPAGLGARDTLRLEMGYSLYGNDIDDTTSPIEAGLGWITKFNNGRKFVDRDYLWMQKNEGVRRRLRGFVVSGNGIPRHGYSLVDKEGTVIGRVTSGTISPLLGKGVGLGYIDREYAVIGTEIFVQIRNKSLPATIVKLPFI